MKIKNEIRLFFLYRRYEELYYNSAGKMDISDIPSEVRTYSAEFYIDALKRARADSTDAYFYRVIEMLESDILRYPKSKCAHRLLHIHLTAYIRYFPKLDSNYSSK